MNVTVKSRFQWISVVLSITLTLLSTILNVVIHSNTSHIWKHFTEKCKRLIISLQHSKITIFKSTLSLCQLFGKAVTCTFLHVNQF